MPDKASSCGGALYAECSSRSGSGGHGQRRGRVAAQYRLSAPNADGKQKRHCAIKLNANGRLDNLLSAICRSSPLEAGGGTTSARAGEGKKAAPGGAAGLAQNFFQLVQIPGIGADLAALPAGYHGLVNVHKYDTVNTYFEKYLPPRSCRRRGWPQREETHGGIFPRRLSNKRSGLGRRAEKGGATLLPCPEST